LKNTQPVLAKPRRAPPPNQPHRQVDFADHFRRDGLNLMNHVPQQMRW